MALFDGGPAVDRVRADGGAVVEQRRDGRLAVEVVAVQDHERAVEVLRGLLDGVGGAELLLLDGVGDGDAAVAVAEVLADGGGLVSDDEDEFVGAGRDRRVGRVGAQRPVGDRQHRLRDGLRQRAHPGPLTRGQDDCLHEGAVAAEGQKQPGCRPSRV